jgi:alanine racemase
VSRRATHVVVDLAAIRHNTRALRARLPGATGLMAVLKADGYGHGAIAVARAALGAGAAWLGVACVDEGQALRRGGLSAPILVLGPVAPAECPAAVAARLAVALGSLEVAAALSAAAVARHTVAAVHLELDSGMNRHGVLPGEVPAVLERVHALPGLRLEGLFTHFACAESPAAPTTAGQLRRLLEAQAVVAARDGGPILVHAANSAATLLLPEAHLDMVRTGIALYGYPPDHQGDDEADGSAGAVAPLDLRPALTWRTAVARRWTLQPGDGVSYDHTFRAERPTPAALLPVGYGDGLPRVLSGRGASVLIGGQRAPILGRVCMDQTIVDVSACPDARVGDEAVLIGSQGTQRIGADELGALAGTNSYETLCRIAPRVPRRYVNSGASPSE